MDDFVLIDDEERPGFEKKGKKVLDKNTVWKFKNFP